MAPDHDGWNSPGFHAFKEIASSRRSYKDEFDGKVVDPTTINEIVDVARWAPSAHNAQPWRFIVFFKQDARNQGIRKEMISAMAGKYYKDLIKDGKQEEVARGIADASLRRFSDAPVLLLACVDASVMDTYPDGPRKVAESTMATQSVAAAIQNLLIAAHVAGLGACWYCAPLFAQDAIKAAIHLPNAWTPQAFITAGYKRETGAVAGRRDRNPARERDGRPPGSTRHDVGGILFSPDRL